MRKILVILIALLLAWPGIEVKAAEDPIIIVLDPGHDATHGGAEGNGLQEDKLNLKIAQYCLEELNTYKNVKVYMTRDSEKCPYPGGSAGNDNSKRVEYAQNVGADVYIALHLNSLDKASYGGVEVFYPNANYRPALSTTGAGLSQAILDELVGLGIKNNGIMIRNAQTTKYGDGSVADYYQVIREAKIRNITGIIVEHAYLSCPTDAENFLSSDAKLKALGIADATGIAKYYGLEKEGGNTSSGVVAPQEPDVPQEPDDSQEPQEPQPPETSESEESSENEDATEKDESTETQDTEEETETEDVTEIEDTSETDTEPETTTETEEVPETETSTQLQGGADDTGANAGGINGAVLACLILMGAGCVACIGLVVYILMKMKDPLVVEILKDEVEDFDDEIEYLE